MKLTFCEWTVGVEGKCSAMLTNTCLHGRTFFFWKAKRTGGREDGYINRLSRGFIYYLHCPDKPSIILLGTYSPLKIYSFASQGRCFFWKFRAETQYMITHLRMTIGLLMRVKMVLLTLFCLIWHSKNSPQSVSVIKTQLTWSLMRMPTRPTRLLGYSIATSIKREKSCPIFL